MIEELVIATTNKGKIKEFRSLLIPQISNLLSIDDFDNIPKIEETGATFEENALIKARVVCGLTNKATISDDSGLQVLSLDNNQEFIQPGMRERKPQIVIT